MNGKNIDDSHSDGIEFDGNASAGKLELRIDHVRVHVGGDITGRIDSNRCCTVALKLEGMEYTVVSLTDRMTNDDREFDINDLKKKKAPIDFIFLKNELISKVEDLLLDTANGLKLIKEWRLRKETFIILNIAKRLCFLLKNNDPLEKKIKLTRIDLIFCFIKGIIYD